MKKSLFNFMRHVFSLKGIFVLLIVFFVFWNNYPLFVFINENARKGLLLPFIWGWVFIATIYSLILLKDKSTDKIARTALVIFVLAALPRIIVFLFQYYIPTNDFANYLNYGTNLFFDAPEKVANVIAQYQMPNMAGLAIFNYILANIFSPTLIGLQIANIVMTSLICVVIYLLARPYDEKSARLAALLYALYPASIISTQITTNHHGATLFLLLGVLVFLKLLNTKRQELVKTIIFAVLTALLLSLSNLIHPSVIIIVGALILLIIPIIFDAIKDSKKILNFQTIKLIGAIILILITIPLGKQLVIDYSLSKGILKDTKDVSVLFKLVVGLNQETRGTVKNNNDPKIILALAPEQQQNKALEMIGKRLEDPKAVFHLMLEKTNTAFFQKDSYSNWYFDQQLRDIYSDNTITLKEKKDVEAINSIKIPLDNLDTIFLSYIYLFAIAGVIFLDNQKRPTLNVFILIFLLWIITIALTEMQPRYRYPAIPGLVILSAIGINQIVDKTKRIKLMLSRKKSATN